MCPEFQIGAKLKLAGTEILKTLDSLKLRWSLGLEAQGDANDVQDCRTFSYRDSDTERGLAF